MSFKCTKFNFGWGSAPDPTGAAHSTRQTHSWIYGLESSRTSKGRAKGNRRKRRERKEKGGKRKRWEGE